MNGRIYLLMNDGSLEAMNQQECFSEDHLQELLARYPELLNDQTGSPRWLLNPREADMPTEEGGGDRWAVDLIFVDAEGVPTLLEVKRSSDTRLRMADIRAAGFTPRVVE